MKKYLEIEYYLGKNVSKWPRTCQSESSVRVDVCGISTWSFLPSRHHLIKIGEISLAVIWIVTSVPSRRRPENFLTFLFRWTNGVCSDPFRPLSLIAHLPNPSYRSEMQNKCEFYSSSDPGSALSVWVVRVCVCSTAHLVPVWNAMPGVSSHDLQPAWPSAWTPWGRRCSWWILGDLRV